MPPTMIWLATVMRVAIAPVFVGALVLVVGSPRSASDLAAAAGLVLLGAIHVLYWWRPGHAAAAVAGMVVINFVLFNLLGLAEPLLWLYPALIAGAGLRARAAAVGIVLTALAAAAPTRTLSTRLSRRGRSGPARVRCPKGSARSLQHAPRACRRPRLRRACGCQRALSAIGYRRSSASWAVATAPRPCRSREKTAGYNPG